MGPPLPSRPLGIVFFPETTQPRISVQLYHDVCCPFSKKMFNTLFLKNTGLANKYEKEQQVQFTWFPVPQPWHPQSAIMAEAVLSIQKTTPHKTWAFITAMYANQDNFFDDKVADMSRTALYEGCAALAEGVGCDRAAFLKELICTGEGNCGNGVTQSLKFYVKQHRKQGVHVTPTVFVNGIEAPQVSSGWSGAEWSEFLDGLLGSN